MVGGGGSGMSGLALLLKSMGFVVTGSDAKETAVTQGLRQKGISTAIGHDRKKLPRLARLVVYSSAVPLAINPEILEARRRGLAVLRRGSVLAQVSRLKRSITVAGTHGKTTTSSMIGLIMEDAGLEPTVIVGGEIRNLRSNAIFGQGRFFVMETDESDGSFLETSPWIGVVTNVDNDHLDHYGSMARLEAAFREHLNKIPFYGWAVLCQDDPVLMNRVAKGLTSSVCTYGLGRGAFCRGTHLAKGPKGYSFDAEWEGRCVARLALSVPGLHNVRNALAAAAASHLAGASWPAIAKGLAQFKGIRRRLEVVGRQGGVLILDDYGHHPTEIAATLQAVREFYRFKRLLVCFQPHRYSRTKQLARHFAKVFRGVDFVWVCPIYAASERPIVGVSEDLVLAPLRRSGVPCAKFPGRALELRRELRAGDCFITIGAGDVWKIGEDLARRLGS